jgi:hypothetical protein
MDDADPAKELVYRLLLGANNPETLAAKREEVEKIARIRAGATTSAATIRANSANKNKTSNPPTGFIVDK